MQNTYSLARCSRGGLGVHGLRFAALLLCCVLALAFWTVAAEAADKQVPATPGQSAMPMLPHLEWLLDTSGKLTAEDMAQPQQQAAFRPLNLRDLPQDTGAVWLRFTLAGRPAEVRPATMLLDMGDGVPDTPTLFVPKFNVLSGATEWQSFTPTQRSVFLMPETRAEPVTAYIRMEGLPGVWFSPVLRTPHNAATAMERLARPAVIVALAVVMLLCLLRGLTERGEWRVWTSLYTAAALVHAMWGIPSTAKGHVDMLNMAAVLAPGVGLMILPHVGRHLMRTRRQSRPIDIQLLLLSLPGAAVALVPLLPGYSWTTRFLDFWPAGTLLLLPTTLGAWLCGLPGARRFLLGCLLPPLGVAVGYLGLGSSIPGPLLSTAPLWGLALGALIIAGTAAPSEYAAQTAPAAGKDAGATGKGGMPSPLLPASGLPSSLVDDDPNLRIVSPEELALEAGHGASAPLASTYADQGRQADTALLEEHLRRPLDALLRDGTALAQCALPPAARQLTESILASAQSMAGTLAAPPSGQGSALDAPGEKVSFDLQELLRHVHDSVSAAADSKNIALSWFMPPHLAQRYSGDAARVHEVLQMLLESAVRATSRGAVQLAVRRVPESVDPGHLLFTVTDTGAGVPPQDRSTLALARAWELAGVHRGFLGMECSPHGASISLTLRFEQAGIEGVEGDSTTVLENELPGIIVAGDNSGERQLLAFFLEGLPFRVTEARSAAEAVDFYMDMPARLLILDGDMPTADLRSAVERVRVFEKAQGLAAAMIMGLSSDDRQWESMRDAGFTHALPKPITRSGLRGTMAELMPEYADADQVSGDLALTTEKSAVHGLPSPSLPLLVPTDASPDLGGLPTMAAVQEEDEEIIDTGMPLLDLDHTRPAPAATAAPRAAVQGGLPELILDAREHAESRKDGEGRPELITDMTTDGQTSPLRMQAATPLLSPAPLSMDSGQGGLPELLLPDTDLEPEQVAQEQVGYEQSRQEVPEQAETPAVFGDALLEAESGLEQLAERVLAQPASDAPFADTVVDDSASLSAPRHAPLDETLSAVAEAGQAPRAAQPDPDALVFGAAEGGREAELLSLLDDEPLSMEMPHAPAAPHPARGKSHEDYLTSLLLGDEEAPRPESAPRASAVQTAPAVSSPAATPAPSAQAETIPEGQGESPRQAAPTSPQDPATTESKNTSPLSVSGRLDLFKRYRQAGQKSATPEASPAPATASESASPSSLLATPLPTPAALTETAPPSFTAPQDSLEWVGEPQPVSSVPRAAAPQPVSPTFVPEEASTPTPVATTPAAPTSPAPAPSTRQQSAPFAAPQESVEWVGEPRPVESRPLASPTEAPTEAPTELALGTAADSSAPMASVARVDPSEDAASGDRQDRPSLLPQSTPFMDFILPATPEKASAPTTPDAVSSPVAPLAAAPPAPAPVLSTAVQPAPFTPAPPMAEVSTEAAPQETALKEAVFTEAPSAPTPPSESGFVPGKGATSPPRPGGPASAPSVRVQPTYGSVGEPVPVSKPDSAPRTQEPPLTQLLDYFDQAVVHARKSFDKRDSEGVREGAAFIAQQGDRVGLRTLARMARCVADAARAGDMDAVKDLLPELESTVERNRIALGG